MPGVTYFNPTGNAIVDGLLVGVKWDTPVLTYSFPTAASQYDPAYGPELSTFGELSAQGKTATATILAMYQSFSGLTFSEVTVNPGTATLRLAVSEEAASTAYGYYPDDYPTGSGGDVWFSRVNAFAANAYDNPVSGDYAFESYIHEIGHALGLKHGQSVDSLGFGFPTFPALASQYDAMEYSVMTYRSYQGASVFSGYSNEEFGYAQTPMAADIAAIQEMYGANFNTNSSATTYTFSPVTGELFINGVGQGAPGGNRIFRTLWDGGGVDTYDFSNYATNENIDLKPGGYSLVSNVQQADLGDGQLAHGNLYNPFLYHGDVRSLIENANGGSGNDTIAGNQANNVLRGNAGNDVIFGDDGNDTLEGGAGNDSLDGGNGIDSASYASAQSGVNVSLAIATGQNTGGAGTDTLVNIEGLIGSAFNDVLTGNAQNNIIAGGAGNDVLDGGAGNDSLDGGAGNDIITFDASDGFVSGGADFDTGIFSGATTAQARAFNMVASSIEKLQWNVAGNAYNMALNGDNTRTETVTDTANSESTFASRTTKFDSSGAIDYEDTVGDNGIRIYHDYDNLNNQTFTEYFQQYAGALTDFIDYRLDTGQRQITDYDQANNQVWSQYIQVRSATNPSTDDYRDYRLDNGKRQFDDYDQDNNQPWTLMTKVFDNVADVTPDYVDYRFDNGSRQVDDYDQLNNQSWTRLTKFFVNAADVTPDYLDYFNDDGTRINIDYDQGSAFGWSEWQKTFDAGGVLTQQKITYDNGSIVIV